MDAEKFFASAITNQDDTIRVGRGMIGDFAHMTRVYEHVTGNLGLMSSRIATPVGCRYFVSPILYVNGWPMRGVDNGEPDCDVFLPSPHDWVYEAMTGQDKDTAKVDADLFCELYTAMRSDILNGDIIAEVPPTYTDISPRPAEDLIDHHPEYTAMVDEFTGLFADNGPDDFLTGLAGLLG